jgi:hypothetical protein
MSEITHRTKLANPVVLDPPERPFNFTAPKTISSAPVKSGTFIGIGVQKNFKRGVVRMNLIEPIVPRPGNAQGLTVRERALLLLGQIELMCRRHELGLPRGLGSLVNAVRLARELEMDMAVER